MYRTKLKVWCSLKRARMKQQKDWNKATRTVPNDQSNSISDTHGVLCNIFLIFKEIANWKMTPCDSVHLLWRDQSSRDFEGSTNFRLFLSWERPNLRSKARYWGQRAKVTQAEATTNYPVILPVSSGCRELPELWRSQHACGNGWTPRWKTSPEPAHKKNR